MKLLTLASTLLLAVSLSAADTPKSVYDVPLKDIDGKDTSLKTYQGKVMLIVNVASKCGKTPQYKKLEALNQEFKKDGLAILGFPCNDFGGQEPGTNEQIKEFCSLKYKVTFPMFDKVAVKGPNKCELYQLLSGPTSPFPGDVKWNFGKFLVGKDGKILKRFEPGVEPDAPEVTSAIKEALAAK
ncbi:glutathione peroxidase [Prosthecobacter vanneervenii]|uniref:Glutathione peroxidase n=1 Tax=Prosthecobacter vanneervenii TaxID=48466 RepID=A0A7W7Y752_9BACT|nr:glutathione peroxidase [Prosthecobacter vanneervenii]MBB5030838.1 glutathione peroxidase [Prosthecobacter vanneervenii]